MPRVRPVSAATRARERGAPAGDLLQHDTEIRPAYGRLIGTRGRVLGALEAHARVLETGDVSVDSVNPAAGFV